jgi:hypothetical protein
MTRLSASALSDLRIIIQYSKGEVRLCELESGGDTLDIRISRREGTGVKEWVVEVQNGPAKPTVTISERGTTRANALLAAGSAWAARGSALGLPRWDWDGVARALKAVQVIE